MNEDLYDELAHRGSEFAMPLRVLTVGAHPDDAEFGAGATCARWASMGADITMLIVTDGSKGSWDGTEPDDDLIDRRVSEQEAAAAVVGAQRCIHLGHVDGELEYSMDLRLTLARHVRSARPDVVLTHDPWQRYQMHPDHLVVGRATVDAVVAAREPRAMRDSGLPAHRPGAILLWSADEPDHAEPVSDHWFGVKMRALLCHASQAVTTMGDAGASDDHRDVFERHLRQWHEAAGVELGVGPSETFKRLTP